MDQRRDVNNPATMLSLDGCQGEVFRLYIAEKKTLQEVMQTIENTHGVIATEAVYKARLVKWGYHKNTNRHEVMTVLRAKSQQKKDDIFVLEGRPVNMGKIEGFARRQQIRHLGQNSRSQSAQDSFKNLVSSPPLHSAMQRSLSTPKTWQTPEKFLHHVDIYIKGSFEAGTWLFDGNEKIILSSQLQPSERHSLHSFLGGINTGCEKFASGDSVTGGLYWRKAFREIETLVRGSYHDTLPNIMQKINDLYQWGYRDAAIILARHIAASCIKDQPTGHIKVSMFGSLAEVDIAHMQELEEIVMGRYMELFELYLGTQCYNSFVMRMNLAARKIARSGVSELDHFLPDLEALDATYGLSNLRPLDVIRTRVEVLFKNKKYEEMEVQADILIERAIRIENNEWQNFYFVSKGFFYIGLARYFLRDYLVGIVSLKSCLHWIGEFEKIDDTSLFDPEKAEVLEKLEDMAMLISDQQSADAWRSQKDQVLKSIMLKDSL